MLRAKISPKRILRNERNSFMDNEGFFAQKPFFKGIYFVIAKVFNFYHKPAIQASFTKKLISATLHINMHMLKIEPIRHCVTCRAMS